MSLFFCDRPENDGAADPPGKILTDRGLCVALTRNAKAVEDCPRRVGAIERIEVNPGRMIVCQTCTILRRNLAALGMPLQATGSTEFAFQHSPMFIPLLLLKCDAS